MEKEEKKLELEKFRALVIATLDYYIVNLQFKAEGFDSVANYENLKLQTEEHFQKGRLSTLKQWFRDLTEMQVETLDFKFNKYLQDKTQCDIDIFKTYFERLDKIIQKGKITSDNQFYNLKNAVDKLCHLEPLDHNKIALLNKLLVDYEQKIVRSRN